MLKEMITGCEHYEGGSFTNAIRHRYSVALEYCMHEQDVSAFTVTQLLLHSLYLSDTWILRAPVKKRNRVE